MTEEIAKATRVEAKRLINNALDNLNQASLLLFKSPHEQDEATCESISRASQELRSEI
jgi:hypothetical protein